MQFYGNSLLYVALFAAILFIQFVWTRAKLIPCHILSEKLADILFSITLAFTIGSLFRLYPGNHLPPEWDSAVFLYIGRRMTEGKIPYLDLFDHKGPLLYLNEYLGCFLTPNSYSGVWLIEIAHLFATVLISCKTVRILEKQDISTYVSVLLTYFLCGWKIWQGGNFTEEYALPWISAALYVFVYFFQNKVYKNRHIVILGISFAAVFLLRANMIAIWIAWIPLVILLFLHDRRFQDLQRCSLLFVLGIVMVMLPTVLITIQNGSFSAMWHCYIDFNFSYTGGVHPTLSSWVDFSSFSLFQLWPGLLAIAVWLWQNPKSKLQWYNLWFFLVSVFTVRMSGMNFLHYQIQMLPCFVLPFLAFSNLTSEIFSGKKEIQVDRSLVLGTCGLMLLIMLTFRSYRNGSIEVTADPVVEYLIDNTDSDDDVLVLGNNAWVYLAADRKTENPFFYQSPPIEISDSLYYDFIRELKCRPSAYILTTFGETEVFYQGERLSHICSLLADFGYQYSDYGSFGVYYK